MAKDLTHLQFIKYMSDSIVRGITPNMHLYGPNEHQVTSTMQMMIANHYCHSDLLLEIHLPEPDIESSTSEKLAAFCNLSPIITQLNRIPKLVVLHQYGESMSDALVYVIDTLLSLDHIRFILMTSSLHSVPFILRNKLTSFIVHPEQTEQSQQIQQTEQTEQILDQMEIEIRSEDHFSNLLINEQYSENELAEKIIEWSQLHCLRIPNIIYDAWRETLI
jgi:hypothetical protein